MGLSLIAEVMGWPGDQAEATQEYAWLRMMSSVKYDGYSFFRAGVRFIETLATWLKQFEPASLRPLSDRLATRHVRMITSGERSSTRTCSTALSISAAGIRPIALRVHAALYTPAGRVPGKLSGGFEPCGSGKGIVRLSDMPVGHMAVVVAN